MSLDIEDNVKRQVEELLKHMQNTVTIKLFVSEERCLTCKQTEEILQLIKTLAPENKIDLQIYNKEKDSETFKKYHVTRFPTTILYGGHDRDIRFSGIFSGYEFGSIIEDIIDLSLGRVTLKKENLEKIEKIDKPMHIMVFVTPTCPYCPGAVRMAHKIAMANNNIIGEMIEAQEFPELSNKFHVMGVPRIVVNQGKVSFEGAVPEEHFVEKIMEAYKKS